MLRFQNHFGRLTGEISNLKERSVSDADAKAILHDVFVKGILPIRLLPEAPNLYFEPFGGRVPAQEREFETQMTAFDASAKRGRKARGFRGVGRLSGLAYCQELLFRSRSAGESSVSELRWDCRKTKGLLGSADFAGDLAAIVKQSVQLRRVEGKNHFFELELRGITRLRNDRLLNPAVIEEYLSQIAPLPFDPHFRFGEDLTEWLRERVGLGNLSLSITGNSKPTFRPHRNSFDVSGGTTDVS